MEGSGAPSGDGTTPHFARIGARGTSGTVAQRIATAIRDGRLRVGERLPSERALAEQFGVSRPTVRKALHALADRGVVEVLAGRGAHSGARVLSDLVPPELVQGGSARLPDIGEVAGVLEARRLFEPRVAVMAGFLMNHDDYGAMAEVIDLQRRADDLETVRRLDVRFHMAIANATHNATIVALMHTLLDRLDVARYVVPVDPTTEVRETLAVHEETLAAIASRDAGRIEAAMDRHLRLMEDTWERVSGRALPRSSPALLAEAGAARAEPGPDG